MHGLKTKAIIARKRAERAAKRAQSAAPAEPIQTPDTTLTDALKRAWHTYELLKVDHWLWRATKLWEKHQRDMDARQFDYSVSVKNAQTGVYTTTHIKKPYNVWSEDDADWLATLVAPSKPVLQSTKFTDIKRWVRSPAKQGGTRSDPKYDWVAIMFSGGGGNGPSQKVTSLCKQVHASTPEDLLKWFTEMLPRFVEEIPTCIRSIELRHGRAGGVSTRDSERNAIEKEAKRVDRLVARGSVQSVRVRQPEYRGGLESNVGDIAMPKRVLMKPERKLEGSSRKRKA